MRASLWLAAGAAQVAVGLLLAMFVSSGSAIAPPSAHVVLLAVGLLLAAGGLALGLSPPFLRRAADVPLLGAATVAASFAGDLALPVSVRAFGALQGLALLLLVAHLPAALLRGARYDGDDLFAPEQPFRVGDRVAAAALATGAAATLASGVLLVAPPRDVPTSALALAILVALPAILLGALAFLLPRLARAPLSGATLLSASLVLGGLGGVALAFAYARPLATDFRYPATAVALAVALALLALLRVRLPADLDLRFAPARPLLKGAFVLAGLGALLLFLAMLGGAPSVLSPLAAYLLLAFTAVGVAAVTLAAGPLLFPGAPAGTGWARWSAALAIAAMFLVAPAFQYPRSAFPGAVVAAVAFALAVAGLWPLARPAASRGGRRMRRR